MANKHEKEMVWIHEADDSGEFIYCRGEIEKNNADRDEHFTVYLPVDPKRRLAAIRIIIDALNKSRIRP